VVTDEGPLLLLLLLLPDAGRRLTNDVVGEIAVVVIA